MGKLNKVDLWSWNSDPVHLQVSFLIKQYFVSRRPSHGHPRSFPVSPTDARLPARETAHEPSQVPTGVRPEAWTRAQPRGRPFAQALGKLLLHEGCPQGSRAAEGNRRQLCDDEGAAGGGGGGGASGWDGSGGVPEEGRHARKTI